MAGATQYTMRDLYPDYWGYLTVNDRTNPEAEDKAAYGETQTRAYSHVDFFKILGVIAGLGVLLVIIGMARGE